MLRVFKPTAGPRWLATRPSTTEMVEIRCSIWAICKQNRTAPYLGRVRFGTQTTQIAEFSLPIGWSIWRANGKTKLNGSGCHIERGLRSVRWCVLSRTICSPNFDHKYEGDTNSCDRVVMLYQLSHSSCTTGRALFGGQSVINCRSWVKTNLQTAHCEDSLKGRPHRVLTRVKIYARQKYLLRCSEK